MRSLSVVFLLLVVVGCDSPGNSGDENLSQDDRKGDLDEKNGDPENGDAAHGQTQLPRITLPTLTKGTSSLTLFSLLHNTHSGAVTYRYALTGKAKTCSQSRVWSEWQGLKKPAKIDSLADGRYFVCIELKKPDGAVVPYYDLVDFSVDTTPPGKFEFIDPPVVSQTLTPTIKWSAAEGAKEYEVSVSATPGCANPIATQRNSEQTLVLPTLEDTRSYYLCAAAFDEVGHQTAASNTNHMFEVQLSGVTASLDKDLFGISNTTEHQRGVQGHRVTTYRYAMGENAATDCTQEDLYSEERSVSQAIEIDMLELNLCGDIDINGFASKRAKLCLVGGDRAGNYQSFDQATSYSWVCDNVSPNSAMAVSIGGGEVPTIKFARPGSATGDRIVKILALRKPEVDFSWQPTDGVSYDVGYEPEQNLKVVHSGSVRINWYAPESTVIHDIWPVSTSDRNVYRVFEFDEALNYREVGQKEYQRTAIKRRESKVSAANASGKRYFTSHRQIGSKFYILGYDAGSGSGSWIASEHHVYDASSPGKMSKSTSAYGGESELEFYTARFKGVRGNYAVLGEEIYNIGGPGVPTVVASQSGVQVIGDRIITPDSDGKYLVWEWPASDDHFNNPPECALDLTALNTDGRNFALNLNGGEYPYLLLHDTNASNSATDYARIVDISNCTSPVSYSFEAVQRSSFFEGGSSLHKMGDKLVFGSAGQVQVFSLQASSVVVEARYEISSRILHVATNRIFLTAGDKAYALDYIDNNGFADALSLSAAYNSATVGFHPAGFEVIYDRYADDFTWHVCDFELCE